MAKKNSKGAKGPTPHLRSRTTRSSRGRLVTSTDSNPNEQLSTQLSLLGLYAAPTIGDGNCLFRALADQVYGSAVMHGEVRKQVCDWIETHGERYEGFVEDEGEESDGGRGKRRGKGGKDKGTVGKDAGPSKRLQAYLRGMRENATYGGHMELSAFAHMTRRNIKVVQPGLVYVIEWRAGGGSTTESSSTPSPSAPQSEGQTPQPAETAPATAERRRSKRTPSVTSPAKNTRPEDGKDVQKIRTGHGYYVYEEVTSDEEDGDDGGKSSSRNSRSPEEQLDEKEVAVLVGADAEEDAGPTIYVAYHDWEHFSSIRNLRGPHTGLPNVSETPPQTEPLPNPQESAREALKEREREKKRERVEKEKARSSLKVKLKLPADAAGSPAPTPAPAAALQDPHLIPLPNSRAASPFPAAVPESAPVPTIPHPHPLSTSPTSSGELRAHARQPHLLAGTPSARAQYRSPKRTFDESSASGGEDAEGREGREKRSRTRLPADTATPTVAARSHDMDVDVEADASPDTPGLSAPGTSSSSETNSEAASEGSLSTSPSPAPEAIPEPVEPAKSWGGSAAKRGGTAEKALTRRQRKALGLPKQRSVPPVPGASAGKIVIPGGRWTGRAMPPVGADSEADEEWRRNGTGRLDVRGFRELKI